MSPTLGIVKSEEKRPEEREEKIRIESEAKKKKDSSKVSFF